MRYVGTRSIVFLFLIAHASLLGYTSWRTSPVVQEPSHLIAGVSEWRLRRFHIFHVNPPLVRLVATLPVLLQSPNYDPSKYDRLLVGREEHEMASDFLADNRVNTRQMFVVARWAGVSFSLLGAYYCWRLAATLYGTCAGIIALIMWCFSPYILGHGPTIMPDVPSAAVGTAVVYYFWRWLKRPQWMEVVVAGMVLGLAVLCKFTLLIFYPALFVLWLVYRILERKILVKWNWLRQGGMLAAIFLLSIYIINCGYLFEGTFTPLEKYRFRTMMFTGSKSLDDVPLVGANRFDGTWLGKLPVPLPANMMQGIDTQRFDFERGLPSYLHGQWADHGWWYYYLYALALKLPLGTWCLVALAVGVTVFEKDHSDLWRDEMVVLIPGVTILIFVSSQTGFSVHSRYVIPALPFLFIWASKCAQVFQTQLLTHKRLVTGAMVVVSLAWSVGSSLYVYPHSLSYFNELAGGPKNGGNHLLDSNIDWGQDISSLKAWLNDHPEVKLDGQAHDGSYPSALAGIHETMPPPPGVVHVKRASNFLENYRGPKPGWYALSVNYLYNRGGEYRYFLDFEPVALAGYSIYIYHITLNDANRVRRELGLLELAAQ